jgi:hypothetical protein
MKLTLFTFLLAGLASICAADPITITYTGTGSGEIGSMPFVNTSFTIVGVGDTSEIQAFPGGFFLDFESASIDLTGIGDFAITTPTRNFVNNSYAAGFSRAGANGTDLYDFFGDPLFTSWNMLSSLGPAPEVGVLLQWSSESPVDTSGGVLVFDNQSGVVGTYQGLVGTPEPSTVMMLIPCCLLILFPLAWLRNQRRASAC